VLASAQIAVPNPGLDFVHLHRVHSDVFCCLGVARYLFVPLGEAVVFAMLASYFFSRNLDSDAGDVFAAQRRAHVRPTPVKPLGPFMRFSARLRARFSRSFRYFYRGTAWSGGLARPRGLRLRVLGACVWVPRCWCRFLGPGPFFPTSDTGEIRAASARPRPERAIEETARDHGQCGDAHSFR